MSSCCDFWREKIFIANSKILTSSTAIESDLMPPANFAVKFCGFLRLRLIIFPESVCSVFGRAHKKRSKKPDRESREQRGERRRCSPFGSACRGAFAAADPSRRARCEPDNSQSCIWKSRRVCWFRALICCCIIISRDKCSSRVQWLHLVMVCLWTINGMDTAWMEDVVSEELRFSVHILACRMFKSHWPAPISSVLFWISRCRFLQFVQNWGIVSDCMQNIYNNCFFCCLEQLK